MANIVYIKIKLPFTNIINGRSQQAKIFYSRYTNVYNVSIEDIFNTNIATISNCSLEKKQEDYDVFNNVTAKKEKNFSLSKRKMPFIKKGPKMPSPKFVTDEQLKSFGYPKTYIDPTDEEPGKDGVPSYYFNIEKTLTKYHLLKIGKIIPIKKLDKWTYNKPTLDKFALKQHDAVQKKNALPAKEQYKADINIKNIKRGSLAGGIFLIFALIFLVIIPGIQFSIAKDAFYNKDYDKAYSLFSKLGSKNDANIYAYFCEAEIAINNKEFTDAKEHFNVLVEGDYEIEGFTISDMPNEADYQEAMNYYNTNNFSKAKKKFYSILKYKDAKDYYYKCGYKLATTYYDSGDMENAIKEFYYIKDYKDSEEQLKNIANKIYSDGKEYYDNKDYDSAEKEFNKIANYDYKDALAMKNQCIYRNGINLISSSSYDDAIATLEKIKNYKDTIGLIKEAYFLKGNNLFLNSPSDALLCYEEIPTFRNVSDKLQLPQLILYGSWNITQVDNTFQEGLSFSFDKNNNFLTSCNLSNVAISTSSLNNSYKWNEKYYIFEDYMISIDVKDKNNIIIHCKKGSSEIQYTCHRSASLTDVTKKSKIDKNVGFEKDTLEYYLQLYVNKKTDGEIILNSSTFSLYDLLNNKGLSLATKDQVTK